MCRCDTRRRRADGKLLGGRNCSRARSSGEGKGKGYGNSAKVRFSTVRASRRLYLLLFGEE